MIGRPVTGLLVLCACLFGLAAPAGAATITEFPLPEGPGGEQPRPIYIAANPNGTLWFTDLGRGVIGAVNTEGATVETIPNYPPSADLAFAPSGTLYWTTEVAGEGALASRTPKGTLKVEPESDTVEPYAVGFNTTGEAKFSALNGEKGTYAICSPNDCNSGLETEITDLSAGPGGVFWAMQPFSDIVRKLQPNGQITDFVVNLPENTRPLRGVLGPDGNLWVAGSGTEQTQNRIFRITSDGQQTSFLIPPGRDPYGIATGSDGNIWFTEREGRKIGRLEGNCVPPPAPPSGGGGSGGSSQPGGGGAGGSGAGVKPVLSQLKITPAVFRVAGAGGKKAKGATGTTISFNLNEGADVAFAIERKAHGRLVGGKCKRQTRANKAKPGCALFLPKGLLPMKGSKGQNSFRFGGRVGGKALVPGNYRLVATAKNDGGASAAAQASFKVIGR